MAYRHPETIRFQHVDAAGILYFSRIFELCHAAMEAVMEEAGRPLAGFFDDPNYILPIVHAEADYRIPLELGDRVVIEVVVDDVGTTSLTWAFTVRNAERDHVHATAKHVHTCVDVETMRSAPIELAGVVEAFEKATA